jgi:hypothetical protein
MTTAVNSGIYKCPWCSCFFFCQADLDRHLLAFKTTGYSPNEFDHKVRWKSELEKRDREYIDNG